jgi:hypothetical protein
MKRNLANAIPESEIFVCCLTDLYCKKVEAEDGNLCAFEFEWASSCLKASNMILLVLEENMKDPEKRTNRIRSECPNHLHFDMTKWNDGEAEKERCLNQLVVEIERIRGIQKLKEMKH